MHSQLQVLSKDQISQVSGGDAHFLPVWAEVTLVVFECFHAPVVLKEFYNMVADRVVNGCSNVEEGDHFTKLICWQ